MIDPHRVPRHKRLPTLHVLANLIQEAQQLGPHHLPWERLSEKNKTIFSNTKLGDSTELYETSADLFLLYDCPAKMLQYHGKLVAQRRIAAHEGCVTRRKWYRDRWPQNDGKPVLDSQLVALSSFSANYM